MERQLTLRGIPEAVYRQMEGEARHEGTSVNKILLRRVVPSAAKPREGACAALLPFAGTWSPERARDFDEQLASQRQLDPELWQ